MVSLMTYSGLFLFLAYVTLKIQVLFTTRYVGMLFQWSCMDVRVGLSRKLSTEELMLLKYGVGEDFWESLGLEGAPTSPSWRRSVLGVHWKDCCWSWSSNTLAIWCKEVTHLKSPWCWERLRAGGEGDNRGWHGWVASSTQWTWVWVSPGVGDGQGGLACCGSWGCRVRHDWATELNWTEETAA